MTQDPVEPRLYSQQHHTLVAALHINLCLLHNDTTLRRQTIHSAVTELTQLCDATWQIVEN